MGQTEIMTLGAVATSIITILSAYLIVVKVISPTKKRISFWFTTWERFMIDWAGEEARPGRDRVPGVMERLNSIDGELRNNGGGSLKDAIDRIEDRLDSGADTFNRIESDIENLNIRMTDIEKRS